MAGESPFDLEFVEAAKHAGARPRSKLVWLVSFVLLGIAVGVGAVAMTAREKKVVAPPPVFLELPAIRVNLAAPERAQTLTLAISLETTDAAAAAAVQTAMPQLLDSFQTHLRELRPTELHGSAGLFRLREELMKRVNLMIAPARVRAVRVRDLVVQ
jgi:flagellar FliL protein